MMYHNFQILVMYDVTQRACRNKGGAFITIPRIDDPKSAIPTTHGSADSEMDDDDANLETEWTEAELRYKFNTDFMDKKIVPATAEFLSDTLRWYIFSNTIPYDDGRQTRSIYSTNGVYYLNDKSN
jgi:hypothetical protein